MAKKFTSNKGKGKGSGRRQQQQNRGGGQPAGRARSPEEDQPTRGGGQAIPGRGQSAHRGQSARGNASIRGGHSGRGNPPPPPRPPSPDPIVPLYPAGPRPQPVFRAPPRLNRGLMATISGFLRDFATLFERHRMEQRFQYQIAEHMRQRAQEHEQMMARGDYYPQSGLSDREYNALMAQMVEPQVLSTLTRRVPNRRTRHRHQTQPQPQQPQVAQAPVERQDLDWTTRQMITFFYSLSVIVSLELLFLAIGSYYPTGHDCALDRLCRLISAPPNRVYFLFVVNLFVHFIMRVVLVIWEPHLWPPTLVYFDGNILILNMILSVIYLYWLNRFSFLD